MQLLGQRGANVEYSDPYFPELHKIRHYDYTGMHPAELTPANIGKYDCVVIGTDHSTYDYQAIVESAQLVVDTRNATRCIARNRNRIVLC